MNEQTHNTSNTMLQVKLPPKKIQQLLNRENFQLKLGYLMKTKHLRAFFAFPLAL